MAERETLGLASATSALGEAPGDHNVLEAKKDGVLFRDLSETLEVDYFTILRPQANSIDIAAALARAITHAGKLYDFTFDFGRADRLVCTEVIYRGYDSVGPFSFSLTERAGRYTLSAEDLIAKALDHDVFEPLAIFGVETAVEKVVTGERTSKLLGDSVNSHRNTLRYERK